MRGHKTRRTADDINTKFLAGEKAKRQICEMDNLRRTCA
jgi:hypothetical protein